MATEIFYFRGKSKWARLFKPDEEYDNFKINVYLDDESKKLFVQAGTQLTPKEDEDGEYVTFRRDNYKQIKNETVHFGPPKVVDKDGNPTTELIGNGSEVVAKVSIYEGRKGKGHRLEGVQILNLVPYEGKSGSERTTVKPEGVNAF